MGLISRLVSSVINIVELLIVVECILSWIIHDNNEIMNTIRSVTNPILEPFRKLQYKFLGDTPIDVSPIFALISLQILQKLIYVIL